MKFKVTMDVEVADHDADVMALFPDAISDRFSGTAIQITNIKIGKEIGRTQVGGVTAKEYKEI